MKEIMNLPKGGGSDKDRESNERAGIARVVALGLPPIELSNRRELSSKQGDFRK